jgi:hypothetical protein
MNKIYKGILSMALAAFVLSGCNAFLDTTPSDRISDKMTWTKQEYVDLYVNNFYEYLSVYGQFGSQQFNGSITEGLTNTFKYGSVSPGSAAGDANDYVFHPEKLQPSGSLLDVWANTYTRIRRINEFLDAMKPVAFKKSNGLEEESESVCDEVRAETVCNVLPELVRVNKKPFSQRGEKKR